MEDFAIAALKIIAAIVAGWFVIVGICAGIYYLIDEVDRQIYIAQNVRKHEQYLAAVEADKRQKEDAQREANEAYRLQVEAANRAFELRRLQEEELARLANEARLRIDADAREKAETERQANELRLRLEDQRLRDEARMRHELELRRQAAPLSPDANRLCNHCGTVYPATNVPICPKCSKSDQQMTILAGR